MNQEQIQSAGWMHRENTWKGAEFIIEDDWGNRWELEYTYNIQWAVIDWVSAAVGGAYVRYTKFDGKCEDLPTLELIMGLVRQ